MKICGTVCRPLTRSISARRSGVSSTRILSIATPLAASRRAAMSQYGHTRVQYITTLVMHLLLHRQAVALPREHAAAEIIYPGETVAPQQDRAAQGTAARS